MFSNQEGGNKRPAPQGLRAEIEVEVDASLLFRFLLHNQPLDRNWEKETESSGRPEIYWNHAHPAE